MNIYEKLNEARLRFQEAGVKKSGRNSFAKYDYFELDDILPVVNRAARELGFTCMARFGKEEATLEIVDCEKPEDRIVFCSPMSTADLKGCHPVQSLGAVETYVRRYLYLAAFEITEFESLDSGQPAAPARSIGEEAPPQKAESPKEAPARKNYTKAQADEMKEILGRKYSSGGNVFNPADRDIWRRRLLEEGGDAALAGLKAEYARRT